MILITSQLHWFIVWAFLSAHNAGFRRCTHNCQRLFCLSSRRQNRNSVKQRRPWSSGHLYFRQRHCWPQVMVKERRRRQRVVLELRIKKRPMVIVFHVWFFRSDSLLQLLQYCTNIDGMSKVMTFRSPSSILCFFSQPWNFSVNPLSFVFHSANPIYFFDK